MLEMPKEWIRKNKLLHFLVVFPEEVAKKSKGIKDAEKANIQVVDEGFLDAVKKGGAVLLIQSHNMVSWGADVRMAVILFTHPMR